MNTDQKFLLDNLQKMIKYIQQETDKKVQHIKKEASKEADLEKALLINPEKDKIEKKMIKSFEEHKTRMKIEQSQKLNKLRLEKLKVKIDCVNSVFEDTRNQLILRLKDKPNEYHEMLKDLLIQGFIKLLDENVNIIVKKEDHKIVSELVETAKKEFLAKLQTETKRFANFNQNVTIDNKYFLPDYIIGGVFMTSLKSKIRVDNTLDKRLELLKYSATPEIRKILFTQDD